jgi:hypothetical protein
MLRRTTKLVFCAGLVGLAGSVTPAFAQDWFRPWGGAEECLLQPALECATPSAEASWSERSRAAGSGVSDFVIRDASLGRRSDSLVEQQASYSSLDMTLLGRAAERAWFGFQVNQEVVEVRRQVPSEATAWELGAPSLNASLLLQSELWELRPDLPGLLVSARLPLWYGPGLWQERVEWLRPGVWRLRGWLEQQEPRREWDGGLAEVGVQRMRTRERRWGTDGLWAIGPEAPVQLFLHHQRETGARPERASATWWEGRGETWGSEVRLRSWGMQLRVAGSYVLAQRELRDAAVADGLPLGSRRRLLQGELSGPAFAGLTWRATAGWAHFSADGSPAWGVGADSAEAVSPGAGNGAAHWSAATGMGWAAAPWSAETRRAGLELRMRWRGWGFGVSGERALGLIWGEPGRFTIWAPARSELVAQNSPESWESWVAGLRVTGDLGGSRLVFGLRVPVAGEWAAAQKRAGAPEGLTESLELRGDF